MIRHCSENECSSRVAYVCNCKQPQLLFCDAHISEHRDSPGKHRTECLIITLTEDQKFELLPKLLLINKYLEGLQQNVLESVKILIKSIQTELLKVINNIDELQQAIKDLINNKGVEIINYELITCFKFDTIVPKIETVTDIKKINQSLNEMENKRRSMWKECDHVIFSRDKEVGGLVSIDLNTFIVSKLDYSPKIGRGGQGCKISEDTYFFYGGKLSTSSQGEAYVINIKERIFEQHPTGQRRWSAGSVLKENKVYIFGGLNEQSVDMCETYDLIMREWNSIDPLPKKLEQITAGLIDMHIIFSGLYSDCCYSYKDSVYYNILGLPAEKNKVVCEEWILCDSVLYKNRNGNIFNWTRHDMDNPWDRALCIYTTFKKGKYIYFIDVKPCLMRINTELKTLRRVSVAGF